MSEKENEFNDEFLREGTLDHQRAVECFPEFMFALYNKEIFNRFFEQDLIAATEKNRMLKYGVLTIGFGLAAFLLAAFEMAIIAPAIEMAYQCLECKSSWLANVIPKAHLKTFSKGVAIAASFLGIASFVTGFYFGGTGKRKRVWLERRALCEAFRQWRWRYFLTTSDEIVRTSGDADAEESYIERWKSASEAFFRDAKSEISIAVDQVVDAKDITWGLDELIQATPNSELMVRSAHRRSQLLPKLADAYDRIRIRSQLRYSHILIHKHGSFSSHPARQLKVLHGWEDGLMIFVVAMHAMILLNVIFDPLAPFAAMLLLLAVWGALGALAVICFERGLRPAAHLGRMKGYYAKVASAREQFRAEKDTKKKLSTALLVEQAALSELREFLQEGNRARFLI